MAVTIFALGSSAFSQSGMQDSWKFYGKTLTIPGQPNLRGLAVDPSGNLHVGIGSQIVVINQNGQEQRRYGSFSNPRGIAIDADGNCYTIDIGAATAVKVHGPSGALLRSWGAAGNGDGQFSSAFTGAYGTDGRSSLIAVHKDEVFCLDPNNYRLQVFDKSGVFKRKWGAQGDLPNQFSDIPTAMTVTPDSTVAIWSDWKRSGYIVKHLTIYDLEGSVLHSLDAPCPNLATSADGLLILEQGRRLRAYDSKGVNVFDSGTITQLPFGDNSGIAVTDSGDVWVAKRGQLTQFERRFSPADNALQPKGIPQPIVLSFSQRPNTAVMDIDYHVTDVDSATVTTAALAFKDNGTSLSDIIPINTLVEGTEANLGANQPTGQVRRLTWNVGADQGASFVNLNVEVYAKDERGLYPFQWITLPDGVGGSGSLTVSARPLTNSDLFQIWFWLVATKDEGVELRSNGKVFGITGAYANLELASGSGTMTSNGRAYLLERLGLRSISPEELTRSQGGKFNFESLSTDSVVKLP